MNKTIQNSIYKSIDNSLNKTIGEFRLSVLYLELENFNTLYYNYAIELPITPCSNRIASSVSGKY